MELRVQVRELVSTLQQIAPLTRLNGPPGISVPAASTVNWFSGRYVMNGTVVPPGARTGEKAECRTPDVLGFTDSSREYRVKVPEGQFENIAHLLQAGEFEALRDFAQQV